MAALSGGAALEKKLAEIAKKLGKAPSELRVGFLESATYPDGTHVSQVAAIQEFGAPGAGIPARPYFRPMIAAKSGKWGDSLATILAANDGDAQKALALMGEGISAQLRNSIIATTTPALSPVTLMLRKMKGENPNLEVTGATVGEAARRVKAGESSGGVSTKPLVETGNLLNSIDYQVLGDW